jgi:hypothetical protein
MPADGTGSPIPLPKGWTHHVRSAVPHVISLARFDCGSARGWAANHISTRVRLEG